jgi:DNA-binding MarR family transcriptional regulator
VRILRPSRSKRNGPLWARFAGRNIEFSTVEVHIDRKRAASFASLELRDLIVSDSPSADSPITVHLAYLLAQANREINRQLETRLRVEGVPVEQWRILKVLADGNGRSMGDLAEAALLNHPTLTKTIDRMVADSLVYRISDPRDRRKVLIFCSDRGKALVRRLVPLALGQEAFIAENYGGKAMAQLKRLLETLIERSG